MKKSMGGNYVNNALTGGFFSSKTTFYNSGIVKILHNKIIKYTERHYFNEKYGYIIILVFFSQYIWDYATPSTYSSMKKQIAL